MQSSAYLGHFLIRYKIANSHIRVGCMSAGVTMDVVYDTAKLGSVIKRPLLTDKRCCTKTQKTRLFSVGPDKSAERNKVVVFDINSRYLVTIWQN